MAQTQTPPKTIFGTAWISDLSSETIDEMFTILKAHNVTALDTGVIYKGSEEILGQHNAIKQFEVDTKAPGFYPGAMTKQSILEGMEKSLKNLGVDSLDLYYFHAPDPTVPIEESLEAIQELYAAGKFKRFGLSNFLPSDVQKIYDIQKAANSVLPTVYQGNFNPVARHAQSSLFPLLRSLSISFIAYSPLAGGFLVKDPAKLRANSAGGRFGGGVSGSQIYAGLYGKESLFAAVERWGVLAEEAGTSKAALAYRWVFHHSGLSSTHGDGVIIGASGSSQLRETLSAIEAGPLPAQTVAGIEKIWEYVKEDAPRDNYNK
ncbi:aldehyde reductase [Halenospora varia]|nr:aldehyde reductase [Halenospora varia]